MTLLAAFHLITYGATLWIGLFLCANDIGRHRLLHAATALLLLSAAVAVSMLRTDAVGLQWATGLVTLASAVWTGGMVALLPADDPLRGRLMVLWQFLLLPLTLPVALGLAFAPYPALGQWLLMGLVVGPLILMSGIAVQRQPQPVASRARGVLAAVTAMFVLSLAALTLLPTQEAARWGLVAAAFDLSLLGITVAAVDARQQGERLLRSFVRELDAAVIAALIFGLPVVLVIRLSTGDTPAMTALLLVVIGLAIAGQTLNEGIQQIFDRIAFPAEDTLRNERAELRATAANLARDAANDAVQMDEAEFDRATRRALSQLGNLPKLAVSPLTHLPLIDRRLAQAKLEDSTLTRAAELKKLLLEAIDALRPTATDGFTATDAWRHFNVLYYPYVIGLKPYRRRPATGALDDDARAALQWFQYEVPERTLYNWQTAAAHLVAGHLRELSNDQVT